MISVTANSGTRRGASAGRPDGAGRCAGFSLIEMSIALVIAALFIVPLAVIYQAGVKQAASTRNLARMTEIRETINFFAVGANRYPRPASLSVAPGASGYGAEFSGTIDDCTGWPTSSGVCRAGSGAGAVLIGAVPFAALGLNPDIAHDYWDNRFLYAVTESQTVSYAPGNGKLTMQAYDWNATRVLTSFPEAYDMILVSFGENARGAYGRNGVARDPCSSAMAALEEENCDMDQVFVIRQYTNQNPLTWVLENIGMASSVPGSDYYDDFVREQDSVPQDLWLQSLDNSNYALTFASKIGVGTTVPGERLHVVGVVRADDLMTDFVCDSVSAGCFNPEIIGGAVPAMDCSSGVPPNEAPPVLSIGNSRVYCASPVNSPPPPTPPEPINGLAYELPEDLFARNVSCAATGKKMVGFLAGGVPDCQ